MPSTALDSDRWRSTWDEVMAGFVPGMAGLESAIAATVEAVRGGSPRRCLDLGGGPGVLASRMSARWPAGRVTMVDLDPVLLSLARAAGVSVIDADLDSAAWTGLAGGGYDLVTSVMTVHYLPPPAIRDLYRRCRRVLAPGGLLIVADLMPDDGLPSVMRAMDPSPGDAAAEMAWVQWWSDLSQAQEFRHLMAARADVFRDRVPANFAGTLSWHQAAARAAGFTETGLIWRDGRHAALACAAPLAK
ncbi:class I SAM-dependent methyltransferase [Paractinoplanes atraurantiacus]|uniref:Methyltransferase domain-containing protein n=1 Tax=Paractinoplanes atraurantiacus TaxID=1036182 RepID=A0A285F0B1_9ACTN|nr:class I SAM-dependent methyltransferase [Actinoplanes atraurantiacus]SNY03846.1 Methyltransferase domain-containing protein [Actinoplanes atraurantiacus]